MAETDSLQSGNAVFLPEHERTDQHIVDVLIEERCPSFVAHWSWPVMRPFLFRLLGYRKAVKMADYIKTLNGPTAFDYLTEDLNMQLELHHIERMPKEGRLIVAINHPTGLADGVAIWEALRQVRRDIQIFANADAIRVSERLSDTIIPVEWLQEKRSTAKTKETLRRARLAFEREECVVIFPSGKLAVKEDDQLLERPWFPTVVSLARKQKCQVLPIHITAENSWLYYLFCRLNGELRDITLFYELLNKKGAKFDITFGKLISHEELAGDVQEVTEQLKDYVSYELGVKSDKSFAEWKAGRSETSPA